MRLRTLIISTTIFLFLLISISSFAWDRAIEAENSLLVAELMIRAGLKREESRGNHFREDFPEMDETKWRKNIIFKQEDGVLRQEVRALQ